MKLWRPKSVLLLMGTALIVQGCSGKGTPFSTTSPDSSAPGLPTIEGKNSVVSIPPLSSDLTIPATINRTPIVSSPPTTNPIPSPPVSPATRGQDSVKATPPSFNPVITATTSQTSPTSSSPTTSPTPSVPSPSSPKVRSEPGKIQTVAGYSKAGLGDIDDADNDPDTHLGRIWAMGGGGTVFDGVDTLYWADSRVIKKYTISNGNLVRFVGDSSMSPDIYKNGIGQEASFLALGSMTKLGNFLYAADMSNYAIRKIDLATGEVTTLTGPKPEEGRFVKGFADGDASSARMNNVIGNCLTNDGTYIYMCDSYNHAIRRIDPKDGSILTIAGALPPTAEAGQTDGPKNGTGSDARFNYPYSIFYNDKNQSLIIADSCNNKFRKLDLTSKDANKNLTYQVSTVAPNPEQGSGFVDGDPSKAQFGNCDQRGGGIDPAHNRILFSDSGNVSSKRALRALDLTTYITTTLVGSAPPSTEKSSPSVEMGFTDGIGLKAQIGDAEGPFANDGTYIYFSHNGALRRMNLNTYEVKTIQGPDPGYQGYNDGVGNAARFGTATSFASDGQGNVYLLDTLYNTIRKIDTATWTVTTVAGKPPSLANSVSGRAENSGYADDVGNAAQFSFYNYSAGMAHHNGIIYFAARGNHAVRQYDTKTGMVTTIAGSSPPTAQSGFSDSTDGTGATARFSIPSSVAFDDRDPKNPYLYISDTGNHRICKIDLNHNNNVTTIVGGSKGFVDGTGSAAKFGFPASMQLMSDGKLYIYDIFNRAIRRLDPVTRVVETVAGSAPPTIVKDFKDGIGTNAKFRRIHGLVSNLSKTILYIMDYENSAVRKYDIRTGVVTTIVGNYGNIGKDQDGLLSETITPYPIDGIMIDATHLLISEGRRLRLITLPKE